MKRSLAVLLIAFAPLTAVRAEDKDNWTGQWVLPRQQKVPMCDKDGKPLGAWFDTAGKVLSMEKMRLEVRDGQGRRRFKGYVIKTDVVKLADAPAFFTNAIRADGKSAWAWRMRAQARMLTGERDSAIKDYSEAIRLDPNKAVAFYNRGNAWADMEDFDSAIKDYTEAIRLDPKFATAFLDRGMAWGVKKDYDKAIKDLNQGIRLNPKDASAFLGRGGVWAERKENDKAIKDYTEAIRLDPKEPLAFNLRGLAWAGKKEYDKAIKDYNEGIRRNPKAADALLDRGDAWIAKKDYEKAIEDYTEVIRLESAFAAAFTGRGHAWAGKREYNKAIRDFAEAIRLDPVDAVTPGDLAWLYATSSDAKFRDGKKAVEYATKACELTSWKVGSALNALAAAYAESGDFEKALKYQKQALADKDAEKEEGEKMLMRLKLYEQKKPYREP